MADEANQQEIDKTAELLSEILGKIFNESFTIRDVQGLTDDEVESVYSLGYNYYRAGKYDDAEKIFHYLCLIDHLELKYWIALGATEQMRKNYAGAIKAYAYASMLDLHDPRAQLHAAECYLALKDKKNALSAIGAVLHYCPDTPEKKRYRDRAMVLQALVEQAE